MRDQPLLLVLDERPPRWTRRRNTRCSSTMPLRRAAPARNDIGRITILVSHRFSTVRMADLIVVLDGARLVEVRHARRADGQARSVRTAVQHPGRCVPLTTLVASQSETFPPRRCIIRAVIFGFERQLRASKYVPCRTVAVLLSATVHVQGRCQKNRDHSICSPHLLRIGVAEMNHIPYITINVPYVTADALARNPCANLHLNAAYLLIGELKCISMPDVKTTRKFLVLATPTRQISRRKNIESRPRTKLKFETKAGQPRCGEHAYIFGIVSPSAETSCLRCGRRSSWTIAPSIQVLSISLTKSHLRMP